MFQFAVIGSGLLLFRSAIQFSLQLRVPRRLLMCAFFDVHVFGPSSCSFCHPSER